MSGYEQAMCEVRTYLVASAKQSTTPSEELFDVYDEKQTAVGHFTAALNAIIDERVAAAKAEWVKGLRVVRCKCMETGLARLACVFGGPQLPDSNCTLCAGSGYVIEEKT